MNLTIHVYLQLPKIEKPYGPPVIVYDEVGLRTLLLGVLANPEFPNWYEFSCFAEDPEIGSSLESLMGSATYRKLRGVLVETSAIGTRSSTRKEREDS